MQTDIKNRTLNNMQKLIRITRENGIEKALVFTYAKLRKNKKVVPLQLFGHSFLVRPSTPDLNVIFDCFEKEFLELKEILKADDVKLIIDAGGYNGAAAVALSRMLKTAKVLTIEPEPSNFKILVENTKSVEAITPIFGALVGSEFSGSVHMADRGKGEWGYVVLESSDGDNEGCAKPIHVSNLFEDFKMSQVDIFKVDIEGSERELLAEHKCWMHKTRVLFVELHPDLCPDIHSIWKTATHGRLNYGPKREKFVSVRRDKKSL